MAQRVESAAAKLKEIVDCNGLAYLTEEPYEVYQELLQSEEVDSKTAGLLLYALINGMQSEVESGADSTLLSKSIQTKCDLKKKAADYLVAIFLALYSKKNEDTWKKKNLEGLSQFLAEEFVCTWKGFEVWNAEGGTVDCHFRAEIILSPSEEAIPNQKLSLMLEKNPFLTKEAIHQYYEKDLEQYLDNVFEDYCTCDDYYQPVVEDFDIDYYVSEWCGKHGFELISCEGDGEDGGYEPNFRRGWY